MYGSERSKAAMLPHGNRRSAVPRVPALPRRKKGTALRLAALSCCPVDCRCFGRPLYLGAAALKSKVRSEPACPVRFCILYHAPHGKYSLILSLVRSPDPVEAPVRHRNRTILPPSPDPVLPPRSAPPLCAPAEPNIPSLPGCASEVPPPAELPFPSAWPAPA